MTKKNLLKTLDSASYVAIICGSILVLLFEFIASLLLLKFAIILFGAGFLCAVVLSVLKLIYIKNQVTEDGELLIDTTKEKKTWIITKLVIYSLLFALMLVFLCLY